MIDRKILNSLFEYTEIEKEQKATHTFIEDLPISAIDIDQSHHNAAPTLNQSLFKHNAVYISKHNRFADYPRHTHEFLEINYMVTGSCKQIVNGEVVTLNAGDILLMDIGCPHSVHELSEDDILINLLFRDKDISLDFLGSMHSENSSVFEFFLNVSLKNENKRKYFIFPHNRDITKTMDQIIDEYYLQRPYAYPIINSYLKILLSKIMRYYPLPTNQIKDYRQKIILNIIEDISKNYIDITLPDLAKKYGYSENYLSSLIKEVTGKNFVQLRTQHRLKEARYLLKSTDFPISEISQLVGINNKNSFYKKFKEEYGCLPSEIRDSSKRKNNLQSSLKELI